MKAKRPLAALVFLLFLIPTAFSADKEFTVVPDTVGIGLQKNFDIVDYASSDQLRCVLYHLGNPWAANVTGWIEIEGNLSQYFIENQPESLLVPSGTFRYNNSCCLLPIYACFKFPYVLDDTRFVGKVFSKYAVGDRTRNGVTGSSTGSSVAYTLTAHIKPFTEAAFSAGQTRCFDIYGVGESCFSAPWIVLSDTTEEVDIDGHKVTFTYENNRLMLAAVVLLVAAAIYYYKRKVNQKYE